MGRVEDYRRLLLLGSTRTERKANVSEGGHETSSHWLKMM